MRRDLLRSLSALGLAGALRTRASCEATLARLQAPGVSLTSTQRDELVAAESTRAAADAAIIAALGEAIRTSPPLDVVARAESIVDALSDPSQRAGMGLGPMADATDALAELVVATWCPGLDPAAVADRLSDDAWRASVARDAVPREASEDPRLGFRPLAPDELAAMAAMAIDPSRLQAARADAAREAAEAQVVAGELTAAREAVRVVDVATGNAQDERRRVEALIRTLDRERAEAIDAREAPWLIALEALSVLPPMRIALLAQALAALLRQEEGARDRARGVHPPVAGTRCSPATQSCWRSPRSCAARSIEPSPASHP